MVYDVTSTFCSRCFILAFFRCLSTYLLVFFLCILSEWMLLRCFVLFIEIFGWMLLRCFCLCFFTFKRSRLRNKFSKSKSEADKKNYVKQRNCCVSLLTRTKKEYYGNLDPWKVVDNRTFWEELNLSFPINPLKMKKSFW